MPRTPAAPALSGGEGSLCIAVWRPMPPWCPRRPRGSVTVEVRQEGQCWRKQFWLKHSIVIYTRPAMGVAPSQATRDVLALGCVGSEFREPLGLICDFLAGSQPSHEDCQVFAPADIACKAIGVIIQKWGEGP